jgi:hypothetical protein
MTTFLNFHALAAARGEGLHPELRLLFERAATSLVSGVVIGHDGLLQSGPDPASENCTGSRERADLSTNLRPADRRAEPDPATAAESLAASGR